MFKVQPGRKGVPKSPKTNAQKPAPAKRRARRGTGSIFPDKRRGGFIGRVPIGRLSSGRTRYREVRGDTRAAVQEKMKAVLPPGPDVTVAQWAARWLEGLTNRPATRAAYSHSILTHIVPELGHVQVAALTVSQVKAAASRWKGLAPQTVNTTLDRGTTMFAAAVQDQLASSNPFALCPRLEYTRKAIDPFAPDELKAIIADWRSTACGALFAFLACTGCREGEATALDVGDYDPQAGTVRITKTYSPTHGIGPPKSKHSVRTLTIPPSMVAVRAALARARRGRKTGPLFRTSTGKRLDHAQIYTAAQQMCRRLGLRWRSPHKLRHGVASMLVARGVPIGDVARWLGDSVATVIRTYTHATGFDVGAVVGDALG